MEVEKNNIKSIRDFLSYFKSYEEPLFYIGRIYCNVPLDLHNYLPNFQIITCYDPYNGRFPFVKVSQSIKKGKSSHKCTTATQCQALVLRDLETIAYMKSKSPSPNIFYMMIDEQCEKLCKENNLTFWGPSNEIYSLLSNKVKIVQLLKKAQIPFIQNIRSKIKNYEHFLELSQPLKTQKIVVQCENGVSGMGTYFIFNQQDYDKHSSDLQNGLEYKIMPYKRLKSFGIGAVTGNFGTVIGPIHSQIIGHPKLTPYRGGFCGNEQRSDYFDNHQVQVKVRHEIFAITKSFGDFLYKEGIFKGMFGIDFVVDLQTYQVYFMEINPRLTGSATISYQLYQAECHQFPIALFHFLEFLNIKIDLDIESFNSEWESLKFYQPPSTHIAIKPFSQAQKNLPFNIPTGIWRIENGEMKFTNKFTYKVKEMEEDEFFFLPNHGFAKGNIIMRGRCQDLNCSLRPEVQEIIDKVLRLISTFQTDPNN